MPIYSMYILAISLIARIVLNKRLVACHVQNAAIRAHLHPDIIKAAVNALLQSDGLITHMVAVVSKHGKREPCRPKYRKHIFRFKIQIHGLLSPPSNSNLSDYDNIMLRTGRKGASVITRKIQRSRGCSLAFLRWCVESYFERQV